jgi:hypothetical protein
MYFILIYYFNICSYCVPIVCRNTDTKIYLYVIFCFIKFKNYEYFKNLEKK